jgi:hypothetical protein
VKQDTDQTRKRRQGTTNQRRFRERRRKGIITDQAVLDFLVKSQRLAQMDTGNRRDALWNGLDVSVRTAFAEPPGDTIAL